MALLPPCTLVIFGATGDLAKKKLIPALYHLHAGKKLPALTRIIAIGRKPYTNASICKEYAAFMHEKKDWSLFCKRIAYHQLEFHDDLAYKALKGLLAQHLNVFYFATPPDAFPIIIEKLRHHGIAHKNSGHERLVFEKPFGSDLTSARSLNKTISKLFDEKQIYRIDHYLGKELVQNIIALRFTNPVFEDSWNSHTIDHIQIIIAEKNNVGNRGGYYEKAGALRDMLQSHLLQMLALTTMEEPRSLDADAIRNNKAAILRAVKTPSSSNELVVGQYTTGSVDGKRLPSYRNENGVSKSSVTETFTAVKLSISTPQWKGVPFYLRTGKALVHAYSEIVINFKQSSCGLFRDGTVHNNVMVIRIQPDEGISLQFNLKEYGKDSRVIPLNMEYTHATQSNANTAQAYERLLSDIMRGDQTLFTRWDELEAAWKITDALQRMKKKLHFYRAGTHGPHAALTLMTKDGRDWFGNRPLQHYIKVSEKKQR